LIPGQVYTAENVSNLINFAMDRGIRVIPEFDSPGQTTSWGVGIPEIGACTAAMPWTSYAAEPPAGQLNHNNPLTYTVVHELFQEISTVFPDSFIHIGSDEINANCWVAFNVCKNTKEADALYLSYIENINGYIFNTLNKNVIAWDDSVNMGLAVPKNIIIEVWHEGIVQQVLNKGYQVIIANYDTNYLDCGLPNFITGGPSWCGGIKSWWDIYSNPDFVGVSAPQVIGGEVAMWTESVDDTNIISTIWPRALAAGELFWSHMSNVNQTSVYFRYSAERLLMYSLNYQVSPVHPTYCDIYPYQCTC